MKIDEISTPAYVCEEQKLVKNLEILRGVGERSGAKILCALKGFAFSLAMPYVDRYLWGATCSGLHEAKFAAEFIKNGEIHTYSPAFKEDDLDEILKISNHVVFNSAAQWQKYRAKTLAAGASCGLRLNPQTSFAPKDAYNPCGSFSRLGMSLEALQRAILQDGDFLRGISGLHFHALCEESAQSLEQVLEVFEAKFGKYFGALKWLNFGGGHHITRAGYDVELLIDLIKQFRENTKSKFILSPAKR